MPHTLESVCVGRAAPSGYIREIEGFRLTVNSNTGCYDFFLLCLSRYKLAGTWCNIIAKWWSPFPLFSGGGSVLALCSFNLFPDRHMHICAIWFHFDSPPPFFCSFETTFTLILYQKLILSCLFHCVWCFHWFSFCSPPSPTPSPLFHYWTMVVKIIPSPTPPPFCKEMALKWHCFLFVKKWH